MKNYEEENSTFVRYSVATCPLLIICAQEHLIAFFLAIIVTYKRDIEKLLYIITILPMYPSTFKCFPFMFHIAQDCYVS